MKILKRILTVLAAIILLPVLLFTVLRATGGLLFWQEPNPLAYEVFGVDVSSYQGAVDWAVMAKQGVSFAFMKATEGSGMQDRRFAENWAGCHETGVMAGAYHFFSYDSAGETQANNFIGKVPITEGALPPVVDIEFYGEYLNTPKAPSEVVPILRELLIRLEAHYGQKPILYVTEKSHRLYVKGNFESYPIWQSLPVLAPLWRNWSFWQYSHHAKMEGYEGSEQYIDLNVFRGTAEELAALGLKRPAAT